MSSTGFIKIDNVYRMTTPNFIYDIFPEYDAEDVTSFIPNGMTAIVNFNISVEKNGEIGTDHLDTYWKLILTTDDNPLPINELVDIFYLPELSYDDNSHIKSATINKTIKIILKSGQKLKLQFVKSGSPYTNSKFSFSCSGYLTNE